jgi:hypothetical protein
VKYLSVPQNIVVALNDAMNVECKSSEDEFESVGSMDL